MCLQLEPLPICGFYGSCGVDNITCVCEKKALTQNTEFHSFHLGDKSLINTLPCDTIEDLLRFMYCVSGLLSIICLGMYFAIVEQSGRHVSKRIVPMVFCCLLTALFSFLRVFDPDRLWGQDKLFTISYALTLLIYEIAGVNLQSGYEQHLLKKFPMLETEAEKRRKTSKTVSNVVLLSAFACCLEICSLPFVAFTSASLALLKAILLHQMANAFLLGSNGLYSLKNLASDIKHIVSGREDVFQHYADGGSGDLDKDVIIRLRQLLPRLKMTYRGLAIVSAIKFSVVCQFFLWELGFTLLKYFIPLAQIAYLTQTINLVVPRFRQIANQKKKFAKVVEYDELIR
mmetsp:Transcript_17543/g.21245  ORF Transcript_17543/g.21245 Transcript_17543/m.21245 type:complete len:344 (+) Transcript_17543:121-1152(+)